MGTRQKDFQYHRRQDRKCYPLAGWSHPGQPKERRNPGVFIRLETIMEICQPATSKTEFIPRQAAWNCVKLDRFSNRSLSEARSLAGLHQNAPRG